MHSLEAEEWLQLKSKADHGEGYARWEVGYCYQYGVRNAADESIVEPNAEQALHYYLLSARQGNVNGQDALVVFLSDGEGVATDIEAALSWGRKAMKQGSAMAASNMGKICRDLNKPALAFRFYQKAVALGSNDELLDIGLSYLFGIGVRQDIDAAHRSLDELAHGNPALSCQRSQENARYWLAVMVLLKPDGKRNRISTARALLEIANADDDHEQANELLNLIGKTGYRLP